jgi:DNA polymerase theta
VALCAEKAVRLRALLAPTGREVVESFGAAGGAPALPPRAGVVVATIEKANMLVNRLLEDQALGCLGALRWGLGVGVYVGRVLANFVHYSARCELEQF